MTDSLLAWRYYRIGVSKGAGASLRVVTGNRLDDTSVATLKSLPAAFERAMWVYARTTGEWAASGPLVVGSGMRRRLYAADAGGGWVVDVPVGEIGEAARALKAIAEVA